MGMGAHEDLVQPLLYPLFAVWPKERCLTSEPLFAHLENGSHVAILLE